LAASHWGKSSREDRAAVLHVSAISIVGAFLFTAAERLEPNRRLAVVFKCAILAAGGAAIAKQLLPWGLRQKREAAIPSTSAQYAKRHEPLTAIAKTYNVSHMTICKLQPWVTRGAIKPRRGGTPDRRQLLPFASAKATQQGRLLAT
jgi:hypothetical protein